MVFVASKTYTDRHYTVRIELDFYSKVIVVPLGSGALSAAEVPCSSPWEKAGWAQV
jgi:hypothetical protein